jgi:hypothetical protein
MTLIITAVTRDNAFQVADTKLTKLDGSFFDDNLVKTTIVHCYDAKLIISYTGLATIDGKRTDIWLAKQLREAKAWEKVFVEVVEILRESLTQALTKNKSLGLYGLSVVISGLGNSPEGIRQPAIAFISNMEQPIPKSNSFKGASPQGRIFDKYFFDTGKNFTTYISVHGAVGPKIAINGIRKKIQNELLGIKSQDELINVMDRLVAMLRLQRKDIRIGHLIGNDCTATVIKSDFNSLSRFYTNDKTIKRFPNIVSKEFTGLDLKSPK